MLNPSNEYVEKVCQSLVREYVIRREYPRTLRMFNEETAPLIPAIGFYGSRQALGKDLGMEGLMKLNKVSSCPLKSLLEVLVKCFLQDRELLLRSSFANSCYYNQEKRRGRSCSSKRRKRKEPQDERRRRSVVIGSHSPPPPPSSHSSTHQESFVSHLAYHQQINKDRPNLLSRGNSHSGDANPLQNEQTQKTIHVPTTLEKLSRSAERKVVPRENQPKSVVVEARERHLNNEDPMATFCRKLQESRIMRNHSKTSLSLEQTPEDGGGDEYDGDSWIPEDSRYPPSNHNAPPTSAAPAPPPPSTAPALEKRSISFSTKSNGSGDQVKSHVTLGQNLLESKQNLLAKVSLSPEENEIRQQIRQGEYSAADSGSSISQPSASSSTSATSPNKSKSSKVIQFQQKSSFSASSSTSKSSTTVTTDQGFKFRDVDSLATPSEGSSSGRRRSSPSRGQEFFQKTPLSGQHRSSSPLVKTLDMSTWQELKGTVLGDRGIMQEGWIGQGFTFNHNIPYALVQKKGGPCGVLAAVQALLLRNLLFGSAYCDPNELPLEGTDLEASPRDPAGVAISMKRSLALIGTLTEILWRCGSQEQKWEEGSGEQHRTSVTVGLSPGGGGGGSFGPGSELRIFFDLDDLRIFVEANLYRFDCMGLVYSVVLTRGIQSVQEDMDFRNSPLLGQHGYCTQELMNLLTMGRAISNAFDHEVVLDEKRLKGIPSQSDIGLLSLFEHYNSCTVGSFLKNPKFPLWIVCSESHFSLLFSDEMDLTRRTSTITTGKELFEETRARTSSTFDLFYYDGLARQEKIIKLTLSSGGTGLLGQEFIGGNSVNQRNNNMVRGGNKGDIEDDDLIPPLEKCIRTKWTGVVVDWNDTEPIM